jgi:hypothetical protein
MEMRTITLSVPKEILAMFEEIAFRRQKSVDELMVELMEEAVKHEDSYQAARLRSLRRMETGLDLQTKGKIDWRRDDLHER